MLETAIGNAKEDLDIEKCTDIVVDATPHPDGFKDPDQLLKELGILGDNEVEVHKAAIIAALAKRQFSIDATEITSGPAIPVGDCAHSVLDNAS